MVSVVVIFVIGVRIGGWLVSMLIIVGMVVVILWMCVIIVFENFREFVWKKFLNIVVCFLNGVCRCRIVRLVLVGVFMICLKVFVILVLIFLM